MIFVCLFNSHFLFVDRTRHRSLRADRPHTKSDLSLLRFPQTRSRRESLILRIGEYCRRFKESVHRGSRGSDRVSRTDLVIITTVMLSRVRRSSTLVQELLSCRKIPLQRAISTAPRVLVHRLQGAWASAKPRSREAIKKLRYRIQDLLNTNRKLSVENRLLCKFTARKAERKDMDP